jgi:hypothetical protein
MFVNFLSSSTIFGLPMAQTLCGVVKYYVWITDGLKPCARFVKCSFWITDGPIPCAGLSNTIFGLPMARNLVQGLSNALSRLPMAQNLVWGLSNTPKTLCGDFQILCFGLSIAQNLVLGCQILLLDYRWPKPFAYSKQDYYWTHSQLDTELKNSAQPSPQSLSHNPLRIVDEPQPS